MTYYNVIDDLVIDNKPVPSYDEYMELYRKSLQKLNKIKLSRYKAMYFGSMEVGNPDFYIYNGYEDFNHKYQTLSIYVMSPSFIEVIKDDKLRTELTLSILYSVLSTFFKEAKLPKDIKELLKENDAFCDDKELDGEFNA